MKTLILSRAEEETLRELLDEEIEETKKCEVDEKTLPYFCNLKIIKNKLQDDVLSLDIRLGLKIGQLKKNYYIFKDIYNFIAENTKECLYFADIKPLYDEFGYSKVNETILKVGKQMFKEVENEQC